MMIRQGEGASLNSNSKSAQGNPNSPLSLAMEELRVSVKKWVRSENELARAEIKVFLRYLGKNTVRLGILGALFFYSGLSLLASAVMGLGQVLGGRFILSSFLISILLGAIGAWLYRGLKVRKR